MIGINGVDGTQPGNGAVSSRKLVQAAPTPAAPGSDRLELSRDAVESGTAGAGADNAARDARIAAAKRSIVEGTYKLPHVIAEVAARLADELDL